jgi:hypothetical protein
MIHARHFGNHSETFSVPAPPTHSARARRGKDGEVDRLTKKEIVVAWNGAVLESKDKGIEMYLHLMQAVADAQYRKCAQSLSQEAVRNEVLEEAAKVCEELMEADMKRGRLQAQSILSRCRDTIRALKREPNAAGGASDE